MTSNETKTSAKLHKTTLNRRTFVGFTGGSIALGALGMPLAAQAAADGVLKISANFNPSSLDPATGGSGDDHVYLFTLYDTLVTWAYESLEARPGLAESWEFTDPQTLVMHLRQGVVFHDGTPFDAQAAKINLDRSRSADFSNIRADLASIDEVSVDGDHVVTLHLKNPDTALPLILSDRAGMMVSPKALADNDNRVDRKPVGAGFMKFDKWDDGSEVAVSAFGDYWDKDRQGVAAIRFNVVPDTATRLRAVVSGQADVAYQLTGRQLPLIERGRGLNNLTHSTLFCFQLYLNMSKKPLDDRRVRQALNFAVDREAFVKAALAGAGEAAYMNLPKAHWAYDTKTAELYPHDPDRARELLAEAGFPDGIDLDIGGYTDQSSIQMQEVVIHQFEQAGIRARFRNGTVAEMSAAYFARGEHDMLLSAWTGRPDPSLSYSLMYTKDAYFNAGHFPPPDEFDDALLASRTTDDQQERKKALAKMQSLVMDHALVVPLAFRQDIIATTDKVQGLESNLLGKPKFKDVSLKS